MKKFESAFDWIDMPEDLPKSNLYLITFKTCSPTIHPEDPNDPIRLFSLKELETRASTLCRKPINLNHNLSRDIESAIVVDAQFNPSTEAGEAMIYVPDRIRDEIDCGEIKKPSVEYFWRKIEKTSLGSEFVGLVFDKVSLLEETWLSNNGFTAGDRLGEIRKCEATTENRAYLDGELKKLEEVKSNKCDNILTNVISMEKEKVESTQEAVKPVEQVKPVEPVKVEPVKAAEPEIVKPVTPEPVKPVEPKIPEPIPIPTIDMTKFVAKEEFDKVKAHETELEKVAQRLTENAKVSDADKVKATKEAYQKGKMEVIGKIKEIIPDNSQFGFNIQNSTRSLITSIKKKCYEMTRE